MTLLDNPIPQVDMFIKQGADWSMTFTITDNNDNPRDLTDYSATCDIKDRINGSIIVTPTVVIDELNGTVTFSLDHDETLAINFLQGVYDVFLESQAGTKTPVYEGPVYIDPKV